MKKYLPILILLCLFFSCEKDITLDLPEHEKKIVVEAYIENGRPPIVLLSYDLSLYAPLDTGTLSKNYIQNAEIEISDGTQTYKLDEIKYAGFSGYSFYPPFFKMLGEKDKKYDLKIKVAGKSISASTSMPGLAPLDSIQFKPSAEDPSLGYLRCYFKDPDTLGNCYRIFTKRSKDKEFLNYFSDVFEDRVINGKQFFFDLRRGTDPLAEEEPPQERGFFKSGDTVIVKWCAVDKNYYQFWRTLQISINSNGNPFASPTSVFSNLKGENALGAWGGYNCSYDTVIVK